MVSGLDAVRFKEVVLAVLSIVHPEFLHRYFGEGSGFC